MTEHALFDSCSPDRCVSCPEWSYCIDPQMPFRKRIQTVAMPPAAPKEYPGLDNMMRLVFDGEKSRRLRGVRIEDVAELADGDLDGVIKLVAGWKVE